MDTPLKTKTNDKGYHIRDFDGRARRLAKAGAALADTTLGTWIRQAVEEKFQRDFPGKEANDA